VFALSQTAQTEIVERPDPGLGRGKWEGSPKLIIGLGVIVLVGFASFLLWKFFEKRKPAGTRRSHDE